MVFGVAHYIFFLLSITWTNEHLQEIIPTTIDNRWVVGGSKQVAITAYNTVFAKMSVQQIL